MIAQTHLTHGSPDCRAPVTASNISFPVDVAAGRLRAVGIVSVGDLAIERDEDSALADVSAGEGNA
jgi:hypothetical protein